MVYFKFQRPEIEGFDLSNTIRTFTRLFVPLENDAKEDYCYAEIPNGYFSLFIEQFKVYGQRLAGLPEGIETKYKVVRPE
jgi:hypothetical protein